MPPSTLSNLFFLKVNAAIHSNAIATITIKKNKLDRVEGGILLLVYIAYIAYLTVNI